jgi:hypothetical protein
MSGHRAWRSARRTPPITSPSFHCIYPSTRRDAFYASCRAHHISSHRRLCNTLLSLTLIVIHHPTRCAYHLIPSHHTPSHHHHHHISHRRCIFAVLLSLFFPRFVLCRWQSYAAPHPTSLHCNALVPRPSFPLSLSPSPTPTILHPHRLHSTFPLHLLSSLCTPPHNLAGTAYPTVPHPSLVSPDSQDTCGVSLILLDSCSVYPCPIFRHPFSDT